MSRFLLLCISLTIANIGCSPQKNTESQLISNTDETDLGSSNQHENLMEMPVGNPEKGYELLVNSGYVSCGIPDALANLLDLGDETARIDGRNELNQEMPYYLTKYEAASGVKLMVANCLSCHASYFNGDLIVGLGDVYQNYSQDLSQTAQLALRIGSQILETQLEVDELDKFVTRSLAIADYSRTLTAGVNPAINITAGIMSHLDPETLTWSDLPIVDVPDRYRDVVVASNPPPWWWYKKKTRMFYSASGGGSHIAWSMLASSLCLDNQEQAQEIAEGFPHILAYLKTISAPEYPWAINAELAEQGKPLFEQNCASCHGTYDLQWTYPEVVIPLDDIGSDQQMATRMFEADLFHDWIDRSFFGQSSTATPELGYVAPPLDGVWATAPYLHNGSVPTLESLLNSNLRPTCWTWSYISTDYDQAALGWQFQDSDCHDSIDSDQERGLVYDTHQPGYGNQGHTYGDGLSNVERLAILEYIKTL
jgi:hypothetical protein